MRIPLIAALAVLGLTACGQPDTTVDQASGATMNSDASADAAAIAAAADASKVTSVDESVGP